MHHLLNRPDQRGVTTFWGISIILMEAVVVFFVFYILYFFRIENPTPTSNIAIVRMVARRALSVPQTVDTAGWLTYSNNSAGVQFHYPPDYRYAADEIQYNATPGTLLTFQNSTADKFELRYFLMSGTMPVSQAFQFVTSIDPSVYQQYGQTVGGQQASVFRQRAGVNSGDFIYFVANSYLFEVPFNTFNASILSTFKFYPPGLVPKDANELTGLVQENVTIPAGNVNSTANTKTNSSTVDTTGWKTYTNNEVNYSVQYPASWTYDDTSNGNPAMFYDPVAKAQTLATELTQGTKIEIIYETTSAVLIQEAVRSLDDESTISSERDVTLSGLPAVRRYGIGVFSPFNIVRTIRNGKLITVVQYLPEASSAAGYTAEFDNILSTLTFYEVTP
ncbi:MAG: hypothetical protein V1916_01710 [Patescibacteria group bacterium]